MPTNAVEFDHHAFIRVGEVGLTKKSAPLIADSILEHRLGHTMVDEEFGDHSAPITERHAFLTSACLEHLSKRSTTVSAATSMTDQGRVESWDLESAFP